MVEEQGFGTEINDEGRGASRQGDGLTKNVLDAILGELLDF